MMAAAAVLTAAPPALDPPAPDQILKVSVQGRGEQIYECIAAPLPQDVDWRSLGPKAVLLDAQGKTFGRHYAGPTWEAADGSKVIGKVVAKAPSPDGAGVDWLLLKGTSSPGTASCPA